MTAPVQHLLGGTDKARGTVHASQQLYRRRIRGQAPNEDVWVGA